MHVHQMHVMLTFYIYSYVYSWPTIASTDRDCSLTRYIYNYNVLVGHGEHMISFLHTKTGLVLCSFI